MELLAPAGNIESLKLAVENGANAVYLGLNQFNARMKADNFTIDNLKKWVDYAHFFSVKVYLTVNILLKDDEVLEASRMIIEAWNSGIDAVIVQDYGLIGVLHSIIPDIVLHFSTQMGVHNLDGALFCDRLGVKRLILARETLIEDIIEIKKKTSLEIEVFAHGALCVSFSGNCYYASFAAGASGNCGQCLQLCRKKYTVSAQGPKNGNSGYFLSPRDLCLVERLQELKEAGVDCIKLEGRLKRPEYTAQTVKIYKEHLDYLKTNYDKKSFDVKLSRDIEDLKKIFNRGDFCEGYVFSGLNQNEIIYPEIQGHKGIVVGEILKKSGYGKYLVKTTHNVDSKDGFKIFGVNNGKLYEKGGAIGSDFKLDYNNGYVFSTLGDFSAGDVIALTTDYKQNEKLLIINKKRDISFKIVLRKGETAKITAKSQGVELNYESGFIVEEAKSRPITSTEIKESFSKLSDTLFTVGEINVDGGNDIFLAKSQINALRRDVVNLLYEKICNINERPAINAAETIRKIPNFNDRINAGINKRRLIVMSDDDALFSEINADFYVYNCRDFNTLPNSLNENIYLNFPIIANYFDLKLLRSKIDIIKTYSGIVANNPYALNFAKEYGLNDILGYGLNIYNNYAATFLSQKSDVNITAIIKSAESKEEIKNSFEYCFGKFPLMTLAHCPVKTIKKCSCIDCGYEERMKYIDDRSKALEISRVKLSKCHFQLLDGDNIKKHSHINKNILLDFTGIENTVAVDVFNKLL